MSDAGAVEVRTIVAIFDDDDEADAAVQRLADTDIPQSSIYRIANDGLGDATLDGGAKAGGGEPAVRQPDDRIGAATTDGSGVGMTRTVDMAVGQIMPGDQGRAGDQVPAGSLGVARDRGMASDRELTGQGTAGGGAGTTGRISGNMDSDAAVTISLLGIPDEDVDLYLDALDDGGVVIAVTDLAPDSVAIVVDILDAEGAVDITARERNRASQGISGSRRQAGTVAGGQSMAGAGGQTDRPRLKRQQDDRARVRSYSGPRQERDVAGRTDVEVEDRRASDTSGQTGTDGQSGTR